MYLYEMEPACKKKKLWSLAVPLQTGFTVAVIQRTYYFIVQDRIHVGYFLPK
jgi:hypothetical protein